MTLVLQLYRGISDHFTARWTEWAMAILTILMWIAAQSDPEGFATGPAFVTLSEWASAKTWAVVFGIAMTARLAALVVNGTFQGFGLSPHIRAAASFVGVAIWSNTLVGVWLAYAYHGGPAASVAVWSLPALLEYMNVWRSITDIDKNRAHSHDHAADH